LFYLYDSGQIHQEKIQNVFRAKSNSNRFFANTFVLSAHFVCLHFDLSFEVTHIFETLTFTIDKLSVLFVAADLYELNFNGSPSDDSFAFGKKLFANYAFQQ
jgi:hypothetical protein